MSASLNIAITSIPLSHKSRLKAEMCEHKGIGHPDSICDGAVEAASQALCHAYLKNFGAVQPYNIDKALLVGGEARPRFGGGQVIKPIRLIVAGRAAPLPAPNYVEHVIRAAVVSYLSSHLRVPSDLFQIEIAVGNGSPGLQQVYCRAGAVAIANDTSFGVGYAPLSPLEQSVLKLAGLLKSAKFRALFPAAGDDFKIMGWRVANKMAFTIALAFIDRLIHGAKEYDETKHEVSRHIVDHIGSSHKVRLNTLDEEPAQCEDDCFLTVTGLSAEQGDDGQVGRGNRINGLITPSRTMSLEAAAGKNPVAHVGKLYNVLAQKIAKELITQLENANEVSVQLLSAIGMPVNQPQLVNVEIVQNAGLNSATRTKVKQMIASQLDQIQEVSMQLIEGKIAMF